MDMEEIFQELLLTFGISVAVCCMIMKLKPYGDQEGGEAFKRSFHGDITGHKSEEKKLSFGSGKSRGAWSFAEFCGHYSGDKFFETNLTVQGEIVSESVEDEASMLQDLGVEKGIVGSDESKCISQEICNVIQDRNVVSEITEDVGVFETLRRREEKVDGRTERVSTNEIEENSENPIEEKSLRWNNHEIQEEYKQSGDGETEKGNFGEIEKGLYEDAELNQVKFDEITQILGLEDGEQSEHRGEKGEWLFDDWEGVERTELEKLFGAAVVFVCSKSNAGLINRDMKINLYGLHKIAIEGPCRGAQPMALNISARGRWDAWKKLGNMSRELAMEQYLLILSERVPGWMTSNLPVK